MVVPWYFGIWKVADVCDVVDHQRSLVTVVLNNQAPAYHQTLAVVVTHMVQGMANPQWFPLMMIREVV